MERYREIEKSIIKKYRKEIWSKFIRAIKDYELYVKEYNEGDESFAKKLLKELFDIDPSEFKKSTVYNGITKYKW